MNNATRGRNTVAFALLWLAFAGMRWPAPALAQELPRKTPEAVRAAKGRYPPAGHLTEFLPKVWRGVHFSSPASLGPSSRFFWHDFLWTNQEGRALLVFDGGFAAHLGSLTRMHVLPPDKQGTAPVVLLNGKILARVSRTPGAPEPIRLETRNASLALKGTELYVRFEGDKTTTICLDGEVRVNQAGGAAGGEQVLGPREKTEVREGEAPAPKSTATDEEIAAALAETMVDVLGGEAHGDELHAVAFSPNGQWLASGSADRTVKLWRTASRGLAATLQGHTKAVRSVSFSRDSRWLASAGDDGRITLWEVPSGRQAATWQEQREVYATAFSPDGARLATGGQDRTVTLRDVTTREVVRVFEAKDWVRTIAFSSDGRWLAAGGDAGVVQQWEIATGRETQVFAGFPRGVSAVDYSRDSMWVAASSLGTIKVWEAESGRQVRALYTGTPSWITTIAFSPDGQRLASGGAEKKVKLWNVLSGMEERALATGPRGVGALAFSPDGRLLAMGGWDKRLGLGNLGSSKLVYVFADPALKKARVTPRSPKR